ncbi:unnamed protein product [Bemisia tabaci]|uniref:Uncharacterized protein n=1 Tax=Bemisia tabaci TaxID=7038 RepID=A0A9N9ZZF8_BEMTA|nr:unnamed protein product [Bemisia tabaci]
MNLVHVLLFMFLMIVVDGFEEGPVDKTDEGRGLIRLNREQPTTPGETVAEQSLVTRSEHGNHVHGEKRTKKGAAHYASKLYHAVAGHKKGKTDKDKSSKKSSISKIFSGALSLVKNRKGHKDHNKEHHKEHQKDHKGHSEGNHVEPQEEQGSSAPPES